MFSRVILAAVLLAATAFGGVRVHFDLFPSDALTVEDADQKTGLRVNLPLPDCDTQPADYRDLRLLNELDGFSPNTRLRVRFSGAVNPGTLKDGIRLVALGDPPAEPIPVNQVVWDPATNTALAKPDRLLDQGRRYVLVVTDAVRDTAGNPVEADPAFPAQPLPPGNVVAASLFTTLSATSWLERARTALDGVAPDFKRRAVKSVFSFSELNSVTLLMQVGANPSRFEDLSLPFSLISSIDRIAFGSYRSPNFLDERQTIAAAGTTQPVAAATTSEIQFHLLFPAREKPPAGYPVVITGHGFTDNRFAGPSALDGSFAGQGLASIAINAVGHGYGPETKLVLRDKSGNTIEVDGGGRGIDLDGDGKADLDPDRIYYAGISLGSIYGTMLNAVEPDIRAAVLNVGGGSVADIVRLGRSYHSYGADFLRGRGLLAAGEDFVNAWPLRDRAPKTIEDPAALRIQELFERLEWLQAQGDPLFFASRLKKPVLWMFAVGDQSVPNPASSALVRAAGMRETTWLYRNDLARQVLPSLDENPHGYMVNLFSLQSLWVTLAAQQQAAGFLASGEIGDPNGLIRFLFGRNIFEVPDVLPEDLNY